MKSGSGGLRCTPAAMYTTTRSRKWRDGTLSSLCAKSRLACATWKNAGYPPDGPLYEKKNRSGHAVRKCIR